MPHHHLPRPELFRAASEPSLPDAPATVTAILGGAGTGKSVLAAEYAASATGSCWLTVTDQHTVLDQLRQSVLTARTDSAQMQDLRPPDPLSRHGDDFLIVIDDAHLITDRQVTDRLAELIRWAPASTRFAVVGRFEPPGLLTRARQDCRVVNINGEHLAFTAPQVNALGHRYGRTLDDETTRRLLRHTHGWAAAVALWLGDSTASAGAIVPGSLLTDYLHARILGGRSDRVQQILAGGAVPGEVSDELLVELTGETNAPAALLHVAAEEAFLSVSRRDDRLRFRFLPMALRFFAEHPAVGPQPTTRRAALAARSHLAHHRYADAVAAAVASADAATLTAVLGDENVRLTLVDSPQLLIDELADIRLEADTPDAVKLVVAVADTLAAGTLLLRDSVDYLTYTPQLQPLCDAVVALVAATTAPGVVPTTPPVDTQQASLSRLAHRDNDVYPSGMRQYAEIHTALAATILGDYPTAAKALSHAALIAAATSDESLAAAVGLARLPLATLSGDLRAATPPPRTTGPRTPGETESLTILGHMFAELAAHYRLEPIPPDPVWRTAIDGQPNHVQRTIRLLSTLIDGQSSRSHPESDLFPTGDQETLPKPVLALTAAETQQRLVDRREMRLAAAFARHVRLNLGDCAETVVTQAQLGHAGDRTPALRSAVDGSTTHHHPATVVWAGVLLAITDSHNSQAWLAEALATAERSGAYLPFLSLREKALPLLDEHSATIAPPSWLRARLRDTANRVRLSPKEVQVLLCLAEPQTVGDVAERLFVSVNTAKTHIRQIYRKLGVSTRREALAEARRQGLL
ncbi:helix-turn-helix transcriptional regulator [Gordonia crocea]|nr:LuxR C-terminal-related transcriptional regulator [Gordonia crocea]